jgi:hemolysin D
MSQDDKNPGREALVYEPSRVSWAVAEAVSMPPSRLMRMAIYLVLALLVGAGLFAHFTSVTITVDGRGMIRTSEKIIPVRSEVAGRVRVMNVVEGQKIKKGQIVLEMEDQLDAATLDRVKTMLDRFDALLKTKDLNAAKIEAGVLAQAPMGMDLAVLVRERSALAEAANSFYQALRGVADVPALSTADKAERDAAAAKIAKINGQGLAADLKNELEELERTVSRLDVSMRSRREQALQHVSSARGALEVQVRAFQQGLQLHTRSQHVVAPADGTAIKVAVSGASELVTAGQPLFELIPDGGSLIAEIMIANRDIAELKVGMPVQLRIDALPYQDFGTLPATIIDIPPDATQKQEGSAPAYLIKVSLDRFALDAGKGPRPVLLGMTLEAQIELRRRTLLELAIEEVLKLKDLL